LHRQRRVNPAVSCARTSPVTRQPAGARTDGARATRSGCDRRDRHPRHRARRGGALMLDYVTSYLKSDTTPGQAGNFLWAFIYILLIFLGLSVAVIAMNWLERK